MKQQARILLIIICAVIALSSCKKKDAEEDISGAPTQTTQPPMTLPTTIPDEIDPPDDDVELTEFDRRIIEENFVCGDMQYECENWLDFYVENKYPESSPRLLSFEYVRGGSFSEFSDVFDIRCATFNIRYQTGEKIPDMGSVPDNIYSETVTAVAAGDYSRATLSGFIQMPRGIEQEAGIDKAYGVVARDPRFKNDLKGYPDSFLPQGFEVVRAEEIAEGNVIGKYAISGDTLALVCVDGGDLYGDKAGIKVYLYNTKSKAVKMVDIGEYVYPQIRAEYGRLILETSERYDTGETVYISVDLNGNMKKQTFMEGAVSIEISSGGRIAYSVDGDLCLSENGTDRVLLSAKRQIEIPYEFQFYYPFAWISESELLYGLNGYEWSEGCGVINVDSGEIRKLTGERNMFPYKIVGSDLYVVIGDMGPEFSPGRVSVNLRGSPYEKVFKKEFDISNGPVGFDISPDGKHIALLLASYDPYAQSFLEIYTRDGELLKTIRFTAPFCSLSGIEFMSNNRILIKSERYIYSHTNLFLVDI